MTKGDVDAAMTRIVSAHHPLLVRRDEQHPQRDWTLLRSRPPASLARVLRLVELHAENRDGGTAPPVRRAVLADSGREHDRVDSDMPPYAPMYLRMR